MAARTSRPLDPAIEASLARRLLAAAPSAELAHVVLAVIVAAYASNAVPVAWTLAWAAAIALVVVAGLPWRRRALVFGFEPAHVYRGVRLRVGLDAILWGLGAAWLVGHADLVHSAVVLIVLAGLVAGALVTLMSDPVSFLVLEAGALLPPVVALVFEGLDRNHAMIATLVVVFGLFENLVQRRAWRQLLEHEEAKQTIVEQDERLNALEGMTTEGIVLHEQGKVIDCNDAFLRMFGYTDRREVIGRSVLDFAGPHSLAKLEQALRTQPEASYEAEGIRKDGSTLIGELTGRNTHYQGRAVRMVTIRDVSDRKRMQAQLQQSQRLEAIGQLAGGVAHDFNNLLTTIMAGAELLRGTPSADASNREDVQTIVRAAQRGADLTRRLLAFSRKQPIELRSLSLAAMLADFRPIAQRVVPEDITVQVDAEPGEQAVEADPGAITQILINLVTNARDAMPLGGRIRITSAPGRLTEDQVRRRGWGRAGDYMLVTVTDTGAGMDADTQRRVFEPFFTTKPVGEGAGLGLSMVYGLMKQQAGYVDVMSQAGRGTQVTLYFPPTSRPVDAPPLSVAAPASGTERILLVDDDEGVRSSTAKALERYGYTVTAAGDGTAARAALEARMPDLIIAATVVPGLSAAELVRTLRSRGAETPVLFTASYADREAAAGVFGSAAPFLAKPWSIADLLRKVREVLDAGARVR